MASTLPSPTKVAGKYNAIFEAYYKQVDPSGNGTIEALKAAKFLKKSGLSDVVLSRIWDLSDPAGHGYLDKAGMFVALKLISLAQAGTDINMSNILVEPPNPPKVGEIPKIVPPKIQTVPVGSTDWTIKSVDRLKYEELFESLQPINGMIPGNKVRGVLLDSKLPLDTLSKIWDLADQDKDGSLDKHEFIVAMHLVYQALDKRAIPTVLPPELQRAPQTTAISDSDGFLAEFPSDIGPPPPAPKILPVNIQSVAPLIQPTQNLLDMPTTLDWVVTPEERSRFDIIFTKSDLDRDGLVSGGEIKDIFLKSGIPQLCLAQIWALCDTKQLGKLNSEQFALAMWFVERKKIGIEPPDELTPNMIPPSMRSLAPTDLLGEVNIQREEKPTFSNPELEMISKEIQELLKERRLLEHEVAQREADIRIKTGEVRSLQSELDTLIATLKQLENQKGEAQKRLTDLKTQVTKIRDQCQKQEEAIREQEGELNSKRSELQKLKDEESALELEYDKNRHDVENLSKKLQDTQLQICQVKSLVTQLEESQRQMNDALALCKTALETNDPNYVSYYSLKLEPDFREAKTALEKKPETADPFNDRSNGANNENAFSPNSFSNDAGQKSNFDDNFGSSGFDDSFENKFDSTAKNDPFAAKPSFNDPFGDQQSSFPAQADTNKDEFGSDPFAILHAPTSASQITSQQNSSRSESPSPALPPKKSKQPPPRPAPPRPLQGPKFDSGFSSTTSSGGNTGNSFANFADFDNKNCGLSDFAEDPFKDYRYEDPFNIQDPFADLEGQKKLNNF